MRVCRVSFKKVGKRYFFNPLNFDLKNGDSVIVETIKGIELGFVQGDIVEVDTEGVEIKNVIRIATADDILQYNKNLEASELVAQKTKELVRKFKLDMKILYADYTLDCSKVTIYFESEDRVDFRELVKALAEIYHVRIELRQVGSRDGAKVFGGIGPCGLVVCCKTFLTEFETITVRMSKNQNLTLNANKTSGICDKLLCCIGYENQMYTELRQNAPEIKDIVEYKDGKGRVLSSDPLNKRVQILDIDKESYLYLNYDDVKIVSKYRKEQ